MIVGGFFFPFFLGGGIHQPSWSVKFLWFHCSCSSRDRLAEKERIMWVGGRGWDWKTRGQWICHLDLNRIFHTKAQGASPGTAVTTNPCHRLLELLEPPSWKSALLMLPSQLNWACFASWCLISVAARRTHWTSPLGPRCCCSNLFLSTQNATRYAVCAVQRNECASGRQKQAPSCRLPNL